MAIVHQCPDLSLHQLAAFHTTDSLLNNDPVFVFHGTSTTVTSSGPSNARTQVHIFTPAGLQSYPRLAVSPISPHYDGVTFLPRTEQGDELCRGVAFAIAKYFAELPEAAKNAWIDRSLKSAQPSFVRLFSAEHAAKLAGAMTKVENPAAILRAVDSAFATQVIPYVDMMVVIAQSSASGASRSLSAVRTVVSSGNVHRHDATYGPLLDVLGNCLTRNESETELTSPKITQTASFAKVNKEKIRLEICQLLDTEENYVSKLEDLLACVTALESDAEGQTPMKSACSALLSALHEILQVNSQFLRALRDVVDTTENAAIEDIESTPHDPDFWGPTLATTSDATGIAQLADLFLTTVPVFGSIYKDYTKCHTRFRHELKEMMTTTAGGSAQRMNEISEKRLSSLLIEPIQRLPRYRLYIENIMKNLPANHPSSEHIHEVVQSISDICSKVMLGDPSSAGDYLARMVSSWPHSLDYSGPFEVVVAATEMLPPYLFESHDAHLHSRIAICDGHHLLLLRKSTTSQITAHDLASKLRRAHTDSTQLDQASQTRQYDFEFDSCLPLSTLNFSTRDENRTLVLSPVARRYTGVSAHQTFPSTFSKTSIRLLRLDGKYEGKATDLIHDLLRLKAERRMTTLEPKGGGYPTRILSPTKTGVGLISCVLNVNDEHDTAFAAYDVPIVLRIMCNRFGHTSKPPQSGAEVEAMIFIDGDGFYTIECIARHDHVTRDKVTITQVAPVLCKRVHSALQLRYRMSNPAVAADLLTTNRAVLHSLLRRTSNVQLQHTQSIRHRPPSPIKVLAGFFANTSLKDTTAATPPSTLPAVPTVAVPTRPLQDPSPLRKAAPAAGIPEPLARELSNVRLISANANTLRPSIADIERTLQNYVLALNARKGNIVGRNILTRREVDVERVHQLTEAMLEPHAKLEFAAQCPVDELLAAFDAFLNTTWRVNLGSVADRTALVHMQRNCEQLSMQGFRQYLSTALDEFSPQGQRAFKSLLTLLAELLEYIGNDADKGVLTAAFCEMIVFSDDYEKFIPLFDRLVEEWQVFNDGTCQDNLDMHKTTSLTTSTTFATTASSGGLKASSLSKRLGLGSLRRSNSKPDSDSHGQTLTRRRSKKYDRCSPEQEREYCPSLDGTFEMEIRGSPFKREPPGPQAKGRETTDISKPISQTTSHVLGQLDFGSPFSSDVLPKAPKTQRKKRRSSLSDLETINQPRSSPRWTTPSKPIAEHPPQLPSPIQLSPLSTHPRVLLQKSRSGLGSIPVLRPHLDQTRTNLSPSSGNYQPNTTADAGATRDPFGDVYATGLRLLPATPSRQRSVLGECPNPAGTLLQPSPTKPPEPQQPVAHSTRKLQAQVRTHSQAVENSYISLQIEIDELKAKITPFETSNNGTARVSPESGIHAAKKVSTPSDNLQTRLTALENKLQYQMGNIQARTATLESEVSRKIPCLESKCHRLETALERRDEECEALYEQNNAELDRLFSQIKEGHGVEELKQRLQESLSETARWRGECARLTREKGG